MKIAIVGAGFSGLATAYHMLNTLDADLTLFDPLGIGGGASGIAAGLMHTYAGLRCKLNMKGDESYQATLSLLEASAQAQKKPVFTKSGLIRIAISQANVDDYSKCAASYPDVRALTADEVTDLVPGAVHCPGIYIESAITVYTNNYLEGLWNICRQKGAYLEPKGIKSLIELNSFDLIVVTSGAAAISIKELSSLPITPVKGQLLELEWPKNLPILPSPLNSQAYLVMNPDQCSCIAGATFERDFSDSKPDLATAVQDIMPKVAAMIPELKETKILDCRAGIRASAPGHMPYLKQINSKCWVLVGMGSKGLLYHAYYAQKLVKQALKT
jgi:glycine/D-amino acid oxidase-like deaminating enzyme